MVGQALGQRHHVLVIVADRGCPRQNADVRHGLKLGPRFTQPVRGRLSVNPDGIFSQQRAAQFRVLVHDDGIGAAASGRQGRGETGRAAANDQNVAVQVARSVAVRVNCRRRVAQARRGADKGLVDLVPKTLGPHEGLVIEARREEAMELVVDLTHVETE